MKKIVAISLTLIGIFSAGAAETLAAPLVVEQGGFFSSIFFGSGQNNGDFSGDNFAVTIFATGTGVLWGSVHHRYLGRGVREGFKFPWRDHTGRR